MSGVAGHAEVVGGGIGGLSAAIALGKRGWTVRLHERNDEIRASGSGIYLWDNGLAALDYLGALDSTLVGAHFGARMQTRDAHNALVASSEVNRAGGPRVVTVARERLINALLASADAVGVEVVTGSTVTRVDAAGRIEFDNGHADADLIVVADGIGSRSRDQLGVKTRRRQLNQKCARVLLPREPGMVPSEWVDEYVTFYSGQRFLLYTPCSADLLYLALVCPSDDAPATGDPLPREAWIASFPQLAPLIDRIGPTPRWDEFEMLTLDSWSSGRVAILGDAAHAQPPSLGQGGGCAMLSALGLAHSLSKNYDLTTALGEWESSERSVIQRTQWFSYWLARANKLPDRPRSLLLSAAGHSSLYRNNRMRAALTTPTGITSSK
ncbi:2-heptyl-4(1H)-quinolone (HHQ) monooxygenase (plasmid) [Rhodococcus erythropolis]|uniref:Putative 2-heptyl-3-hydroxy-4(1H)-quinolone synthase AqdB1 n=1 Tax=Rhodococcus erythropolis TaxID=1833 RepID=AQDB1_RHOER|nr:FAD-dependent monooxygenase [Rhodococcus erythropolis]A0A0E4AFG7.1 RecName: Full=Putative 2-heptyl-3-hydroxy-4(1H)-quinolone synthase AqdB1; AltName: Full=2-heptyl-4-quinolone monooxygenase; Short=HHQ monooxygenase [Rhodococcus erythropolis]AKE01129.1 2-heptyl-4(1H)-quinolone (HHQ) monooxygenase [Rhodococcus erythropolis]